MTARSFFSALAIACVLILPPAGCGAYRSTETNVTATVKRRERVSDRTGSYYLVFTDKGVYQCSDTWIYGRWDSSDLYSSLEDGKTFTMTVVGWRVPFLSWFPNIIRATEVAK